jgi:hypothetical protein
MDWRSRVGRPKYLVLYRTTTRWRYAIYTTGGVADGYLDTPLTASAERAQLDLAQCAEELVDFAQRAEESAREPLAITWRPCEPDGWTGEVASSSDPEDTRNFGRQTPRTSAT